MRLLRALFAVVLLLATQALGSVGCLCSHGREDAASAHADACCSACVRARPCAPLAGARERAPVSGRHEPTDGPNPRNDGTCDCGRGQPLMGTESWAPMGEARTVAPTLAPAFAFVSMLAHLPPIEGAGPPLQPAGEPPGGLCSAHPELLPVLTI